MKMLTAILSLLLFSSAVIYGLDNRAPEPPASPTRQVNHPPSFFSGVFTYLSEIAFGKQANEPEGTVHNVVLKTAAVSKVTNEQIVVTMETSGDLRGSLSLILTRDPSNNAITRGDWALVNSYIELVETHHHEDSEADQHHDDSEGEPHPGGELPIDKGTLRGYITGGSITFNENGDVTALNDVQMNVISGSLTYSAVSAGGGTIAVSNLNDVQSSTGTLTLNF